MNVENLFGQLAKIVIYRSIPYELYIISVHLRNITRTSLRRADLKVQTGRCSSQNMVTSAVENSWILEPKILSNTIT